MELRQLVALDGVSGGEKAVRRAIFEEAKQYCGDVRIDCMGNVICYKPGKREGAPHVLVSAHMDEVGFMVVGATGDNYRMGENLVVISAPGQASLVGNGLLKIRPVGGIDPRVAVSKHVRLGEEQIKGVIGAMAIHLQSDADRRRVLDYDALYIDIGAKCLDEALAKCPKGTYAAFDTEYVEFGDGFCSAKALDDRVGCYSLLEALKGDYACELTCAFVTQEEVGLRGATGAAFAAQPDIALVLEGTAANDVGTEFETDKVCRAGQGVAISFMDNATIADRQLFKRILGTAQAAGVAYQIKQGVTGGNDAGAYQRAGTGCKTCVLSVPCRYIHGPSSVCHLGDVAAQAALVKAFLTEEK